MELKLECQTREPGSKPNALRRQGRIPATVYGQRGTESLAVTLDAKAVETLLKGVVVNNTLIQLNIPDASWSGRALLREIQTHPAKPLLYHLSFFAVSAQDSLTVDVPLHVVGEAASVKQNRGALDTVLTELQVQCSPDSIPEFIDVNVSNMQVGDSLYVRDLQLPQGVTVTGDTSRVVVTASGTAANASSEPADQPE